MKNKLFRARLFLKLFHIDSYLKETVNFIKMAPRSRSTMSKKAGILFPAARVHRKLKSLPKQVNRVSKGAAVYLAGVMEYLVGK